MLSDQDRAILDFERTWWTGAGPKQRAIKERLGLSGTRYYQRLGTLVESPEALAYDPLVVRRVRRDRLRRRLSRFEGHPAGERSDR
ncbi:hypothetical protein BH24ACT3_BH24ACT3_12430 [soil metagenome]